jgi:hypothetical protein
MNAPISPTTTPAASRSTAELLITAGGIITSTLVVALNVVLARVLDFDFLSLSLWFVIPVGALIGGFGAAGGYTVGEVGGVPRLSYAVAVPARTAIALEPGATRNREAARTWRIGF